MGWRWPHPDYALRASSLDRAEIIASMLFELERVSLERGGKSVLRGLSRVLPVDIFTFVPGAIEAQRVALPAMSASPAAEAAAEPPSEETERTGSVLIVEDDETGARSLSRILRPNEVTIAHNGRQALDAIRAGKRFDAILCDLMMPEMTGMDLHRELARERPDLLPQMIFMTGGAFTPAAREFLERIPNECIEKPCEPRMIVAIVQRIMG